MHYSGKRCASAQEHCTYDGNVSSKIRTRGRRLIILDGGLLLLAWCFIHTCEMLLGDAEGLQSSSEIASAAAEAHGECALSRQQSAH